MKSILITGAAGFVGSHMVERCLEQGWGVFGVDDFSSGLKKNLQKAAGSDRFEFLKTDLALPDAVATVDKWLKSFGAVRLNTVANLTARKIPRYGGRLETILVNLRTTETACELARLYRSKIVFASTSDVYGLSPKLPFKESGEVTFGPSEVARWAYGAGKYAGEQMVWGYHEEYGLPMAILRIFGVYGPRQVAGWKGNAVSAFFQQAIGGGEYELHGDGKQTRTFLYIDDLIDGLAKAIAPKGIKAEVINLGSSEEISMINLANKIHRLVCPKEKIRFKYVGYKSFTGRPYQDVRVKLPNLILARKLLGWQPKTGLWAGLHKTWEWYQSK